MTITPNSPSELPLVLIVATIGFRSQILANFKALFVDILFELFRTRTIKHPATMSPIAKSTLPNENHVLDHVVGSNIQASKGVYRYVSRS
jgi:L-2-hydroxyglutarate oxidase LhgO